MINKKEVDFSEKEEYIRWFSELSNKDVAIAGGKGASLSEMFNHKFPVPPGFVITAQSFDIFISNEGLKEKINSVIKEINMEDTEELENKSKEIRELIENQKFPKKMENEILEAYHILSSEKIDTFGVSSDALNILKHSQESVFVSVRSSATTEDSADASFAGQQESFLNIKGDRKLIENIKKCFSSLYTSRAIYYRHKRGFKESESLLAVVVQKMIDSEKSGVIFSKDPVSLDDNIIIESVFGLGEGIVSGKIKPDSYTVTRELEIKDIRISEKKIAIVRTGSGENEIVKLSKEKGKSRTLTTSQILELANYAIKLEKHYKMPQDIEFAIDSEKTYIVQSRPITTLKEKKKTGMLSGKVLLEGSGSSSGIGVGIVRIVKTMDDLKKIKKGDVLVTEMTNPDMVVSMQKAVAIVTDEGGITAHASIVSRELGIPCIVGTGNATSVLKNEMKVTVDGTNGKVYEGEVAETHYTEIKPVLETSRIKIKLIVDLPESAERALQSKVHYIGLMRLEGIIAGSGKHPLLYEKEDNLEDYTELLKRGIEKISEHFKSIWIRASDIRTDEFSTLKGAPEKELNPMLGLHGIRFSLKHPKILEAELMAIKKIAEKHPEKKFGIMFPQIISVEEVRQAKEFFNKFKTPNMEFGIMVETPAAVQIIEDICRQGINFISFGTNDLTQFTLAVDRGEEDVQFLYNELNPAIFSQIKRVLRICKQYRVETSICGQAGSKKEMIEFLFRYGINSISVNADAAYETSRLIKELEEKREEFFKSNKDFKKTFKQKDEDFRNFKKPWNKDYNNQGYSKNFQDEENNKNESAKDWQARNQTRDEKIKNKQNENIELVDNLEEIKEIEEDAENNAEYEKREKMQENEDIDEAIQTELEIGDDNISDAAKNQLEKYKKKEKKEKIESFYDFNKEYG